MHSDTGSATKNMVELDVSLAQERRVSILEEDLAISSSTHDSSQIENAVVSDVSVMPPDLSVTCPTFPRSPSVDPHPLQQPVIYVNENAMDCNYDESSGQSKISKASTEVEENPPSPELFESDVEDEVACSTTSSFKNLLSQQLPTQPSPKKVSTPEMIARADKWLLKRVNKFLSGIPPPPSQTISQKDCDHFIIELYKNRQYFWADPFELDRNLKPVNHEANALLQKLNQEKAEAISSNCINKVKHQTKAGLRNLSTAFDECEQASNSKDSSNIAIDFVSDTTSSFTLSETLLNSTLLSSSSSAVINEDSKICDNDQKPPPTLFQSIKVDEIIDVPWPDAYNHKCHGLYYNRNNAIESFEDLRMKFCSTYIGTETQSTCNIWFKRMPGSAKKRTLLAKRSPGKRLSYLARRRKTFSSSNVQDLGLAERKILLNMSKLPMRKGKSPRGKSPRGKSPRKRTPRSSAKKRILRRLQLDGPSPRKTKIETSKRALFQSPPHEKAGPSRAGPSRVAASSTVTNNNNNNISQKCKRALFPTPKKSESSSISQSQESRKRKSEDELENSRAKWPKSISFDCGRNIDSSSSTSQIIRNCTSSVLPREGTSSQDKSEFSQLHRKKLIWAVTTVLKEKGIDMKHEMYKKYTGNLGRIVRKHMPDLENKNLPRKPGSTSDRMMKLAKQHVHLVINAKTT